MFVVLSVEAVPTHLHGYISRFLTEATTGAFVGNLSTRVADALWERVCEASDAGRVALIRSAPTTEAGFSIQLSGHELAGRGRAREVVELDGLELIAERPNMEKTPKIASSRQK